MVWLLEKWLVNDSFSSLTSMFHFCLVISIYVSSLPVAHLSDTLKGQLVVTGDSARIQDETTESFAWFFNYLGVKLRHMGPRFDVSSERLFVILDCKLGI